jgi:hypothetical protein
MSNITIKKIKYTEITVTKLKDQLWRVDEPINIKLYLDTGVIRLFIKPGFEFDFGSIPKPFRSFIDPIGEFGIAYLIHDFGYVYHGFSRNTWDSFLYQSLKIGAYNTTQNRKTKTMSTFKAACVYKAVDWFGESSYLSNLNKRDFQKTKLSLTWDSK